MAKLKLNIGDPVIVNATIDMGYDAKGNRKAYRSKFPKLVGFVIGATRRQYGKYRKGSHFMCDPEDYDPPELHVKGTITVYRVSLGLFRKPFDVLPCDLRKVPAHAE